MSEFHGDLLIGGSTLRKLHGELEVEQPLSGSRNWSFVGRLDVPNQQAKGLQLERQYLLKLSDGREGLIQLISLTPLEEGLLAKFRPCARRSS
jgi:hypothetical protein